MSDRTNCVTCNHWVRYHRNKWTPGAAVYCTVAECDCKDLVRPEPTSTVWLEHVGDHFMVHYEHPSWDDDDKCWNADGAADLCESGVRSVFWLTAKDFGRDELKKFTLTAKVERSTFPPCPHECKHCGKELEGK